MAWKPQIEQWRAAAIQEARDIPPDLILAIIDHESGGIAGSIGQAPIATPGEVLRRDGGAQHVDRALGLMQCIPAAIKGYNDSYGKSAPIFYEDMIGRDFESGRKQIRVGAALFAVFVQALHKYDPLAYPGKSPGSASTEQLLQTLVCYAIGPGNLFKKLDLLKAAGAPLTWQALYERFPTWGQDATTGKWNNRPLYASAVEWRAYETNRSDNRPATSPATSPAGAPPVASSALDTLKGNTWLLGILALVLAYVARRYMGKGETA